MLAKTAEEQGATSEPSPRTQAELLDQLIKRRLVTQVLTREGGYYTDAEIDDLIAASRPRRENITIENFAAGQGTSLDAIRSELIWQIAWGRYVERNIAEQLQAYFDAHHKDFDGTQVRASHILLRPAGGRVERTVDPNGCKDPRGDRGR